MSLNRATIIGFLGRDPELRSLPNSQAVAHLSVATDESFKDDAGERQNRVEWHNVVVFGKLAETCAKYLKKGRQVYVEGRLHMREWESDKQRHQRTERVASRVQFLGTPAKDEPAGGENGDAA
jgi:single-strand DNA-binding protein